MGGGDDRMMWRVARGGGHAMRVDGDGGWVGWRVSGDTVEVAARLGQCTLVTNRGTMRLWIPQPLPATVRFHVVASQSAENTMIQFLGAKRGIGNPVWGIGKFAGDGTVPKISALARVDPATVMWSHQEHGLIFNDDAIWPGMAAALR